METESLHIDTATLFNKETSDLISKLHSQFEARRQELLKMRKERQKKWDEGELPQYLDQDSEMVTGDWKVAPIPEDLLCRRVEITGPVNDPKMVINMLNRTTDGHRADTAMLDFEDSMMPNWDNVLNGYKNIYGAVRGELEYVKEGPNPKHYKLNKDDMAKVMVRVRGLHMNEAHYKVKGQNVSAGLMDLAVVACQNARYQIENGITPKFYVPKCEHHLEARWWNDVFTAIEDELNLKRSSLRATFLIETLPAAFQIEEILYELRDHAAGLNVGRWDKIFSDIKCLRNHPDRIAPDRATINMSKYWMDNYAKRLIKICHERGAFAIGGMSAFTPGKTPELRQKQEAKVAADKNNEANIGHDGCWVSHPYFIKTAMSAFQYDNQLDKKLDTFSKTPDLIMDGEGPKTMDGLSTNIRVGIAYMHGWNKGIGCVAWDGLMEDLATLEISRAQTWQWLKNNITLDSGEKVTKELVRQVFDNELNKIIEEIKNPALNQEFIKAKEDAQKIFLEDELRDFLTV